MICGILLILFVFFTSCGKTPSYDTVNTDIVASVNGELIHRDELITLAKTYDSTDEVLYEELLDALIDEKLEFQRAEAMGCTELTTEELTEIENAVALEVSERYQYYYEQMRQNYPDANENSLASYTQNAVAAYIAESGETDAELIRSYTEAKILEKLYNTVTAEVSVTEEEIFARYEEYVAADQKTYTAHPEYFESDKTTNAVYYNLPGYRYVKHIRLSSEENAETILERTATENFDHLIEEATEDRASLNYPNGFAVGENSELYIEGYADAALSLEQPGDISEVVALEDGFYIIKYVQEIPAGAEDFLTMRQYVENDLLDAMRSETYSAALAEWREAAEIDVFLDILDSLSEETEHTK